MPVTTKPESKAKTKEITIKVANTTIVLGTTYDVIHKKDLDAPMPIKGIPTTKAQSPGIKHNSSVIFNEETRRWDTGFEVESIVCRSIPPEEKKARIDAYVKMIQEPYEKYYRTDTNSINDDFWGGNDELGIPPYQIQLWEGKSYNTNNPKDLFDLFQALIQGKVCEPGEKTADLQRSAVYCIKNVESSVSKEEQRLVNKAEAYATFQILLDSVDPEKDDTLYTILEWLNYSNIRGAEKDALRRTVLTAFEQEKTGQDTIERFLEAYKMSKADGTKKEMEMFSVLSKLHRKNKLEVIRKQFYLDGVLLGNSLKEAAKIATIKPEIRDSILEVWNNI